MALLAVAGAGRLPVSAVVSRSAALRTEVRRDGELRIQHRGGAVIVTVEPDGRRVVTLMTDGTPPRR